MACGCLPQLRGSFCFHSGNATHRAAALRNPINCAQTSFGANSDSTREMSCEQLIRDLLSRGVRS